MNVFLPYSNFEKCAACLDSRRLWKQVLECHQILNLLAKMKAYEAASPARKRQMVADKTAPTGWKNHPAVLMWVGYERALEQYMRAAMVEWIAVRGGACSLRVPRKQPVKSLPPWMGKKNIHAGYRSNLLRKDAVHYGRFGWKEPDSLPYCWPVESPAKKRPATKRVK
jgi:hypothetical protein